MEKKVFAVFGLGTFGLQVCKALSEKGAIVIAVDKDERVINSVKDMVSQAVFLDSTNEEALQNAGLQDVDVAVIAMGRFVDSSILTTILLKNIGIPRIIARAMSDVHEAVLKQVGATEVINVEIEQGKRLANRIFAPTVIDVIPVSGDQALAELHVPAEFSGKSLRDLDIRNKYNINIISIKRTKTEIDAMGNPKREELVFSPKPMDILNIDDIMVVLGTEDDIDKFKESVK
jgi:trk system potassium uptake protein TrkA